MSKSLKSSPLQKRFAGWKKMKTSRKVWTVILVVVLGYFFVVKPVIGFVDKQKFEKAAAKLEELFVEIKKVAGKPDQVVRDKSCGYSSAKFSKGNLGCGVYLSLQYNNLSPEAATEKSLAASKLFSDIPSDLVGKEIPIKFVAALPNSQKFHQGINESVVSPYCLISYNSPSIREGGPFIIRLGCSGEAKAEHYPVDK